MALFHDAAAAAAAARDLRGLGIPRERVSIVARSHDEEGALPRRPAHRGSEIEDSRPASRLGELAAHLAAAVAVVIPGVGPIVTDGPLAAALGEAAGHMAGDIARALEHAGLESGESIALGETDRGRRISGGCARRSTACGDRTRRADPQWRVAGRGRDVERYVICLCFVGQTRL